MRCPFCNNYIWFWQQKIFFKDNNYSVHWRCYLERRLNINKYFEEGKWLK